MSATVYDVTRRETFTNLSEVWAKEVDLYSTNQDCIKMLVGNKVDKVFLKEIYRFKCSLSYFYISNILSLSLNFSVWTVDGYPKQDMAGKVANGLCMKRWQGKTTPIPEPRKYITKTKRTLNLMHI